MGFIKNYYINKKIKGNISELEFSGDFNSNKVDKIACLIDAEKIRDIKAFEELAEFFSIRSENCIFLGYQHKNNETIGSYPLYTYKDISIRGIIKNPQADRLRREKYDILINYFDTPKKELLLLSSGIKTKLRVGLSGIDEVYNDIIIDCDITKEKIFTSELQKIVQTFKSK